MPTTMPRQTSIALRAAAQTPRFGRTLDAAERLSGVERGAAGQLDELLHLLDDEVRSAAHAIRQMSTTERGKKGPHLRLGEMTVAEVIEQFIVAHAEEHLAQVRAVLGG